MNTKQEQTNTTPKEPNTNVTPFTYYDNRNGQDIFVEDYTRQINTREVSVIDTPTLNSLIDSLDAVPLESIVDTLKYKLDKIKDFSDYLVLLNQEINIRTTIQAIIDQRNIKGNEDYEGYQTTQQSEGHY